MALTPWNRSRRVCGAWESTIAIFVSQDILRERVKGQSKNNNQCPKRSNVSEPRYTKQVQAAFISSRSVVESLENFEASCLAASLRDPRLFVLADRNSHSGKQRGAGDSCDSSNHGISGDVGVFSVLLRLAVEFV